MIKNIITDKKTTIVGLLVGITSLLKATNVISEEVFGAAAALIPYFIDAILMVYLVLSKDAK